ncbi:hypothetical protein RUND412_006414 [Rhizina undulata]
MVDYDSCPFEGSGERVNPAVEHVGSCSGKDMSGGGNNSGALKSKAADFLFKNDDKALRTGCLKSFTSKVKQQRGNISRGEREELQGIYGRDLPGSPTLVRQNPYVPPNIIGTPRQSHGTCGRDLPSFVHMAKCNPASDGPCTTGNSSSGAHDNQSPRPGRLARSHGCLNLPKLLSKAQLGGNFEK